MILCAKFREHHIVSIAHRIPLGQHLFDRYQLCPAEATDVVIGPPTRNNQVLHRASS
jgi:hypothetical protein